MATIVDLAAYRTKKESAARRRTESVVDDSPLETMFKACTAQLIAATNVKIEYNYFNILKGVLTGKDQSKYYLIINTKVSEDLKLPPFLRKYENININIQWGNYDYLNPDKYGFGISLYWDDVPYNLYIPYDTIIELKQAS